MSNWEEKIRRKFNKGCVDYALLEDGDRILVGLSGGKDSLLLAELLADRARIFRPSIRVEAAHVVMENIPYETDQRFLETFCQGIGLPLHILHSRFDETADPRKSHCFLCSWHRRKALFRFAEEEGFNKVALGHHQDDILTTWLMNITFEGNASTMLPKLALEHYALQIVRPLCLVKEEWIKEVAAERGYAEQKRKCPFEDATKRRQMQLLFQQIESMNPEARHAMWKAMLGISPTLSRS